MFERNLNGRAVVGAVVAVLAIAAPPAAAAAGPGFVPRQTGSQRLGGGLSPTIRDRLGEIGAWAVPSIRSQTPGLGEGLTGADRSWLAASSPTASSPQLHMASPRLGEGLTGADRSWLAASSPTVSPPEPHVALPPNGFDWGAAGIGAGIAAAVLLIVTGSAVVIRKRVSPAH